jgi:hypothetical protein
VKFMVFTSPTDDTIKHPPTAAMYNSQISAVRDAIETGKLDTAFHGRGRALYITNGASEQEVDDFFRSIPLAGQMQRTIEPLEDFFEHAERISAYLATHGDGRGGT